MPTPCEPLAACPARPGLLRAPTLGEGLALLYMALVAAAAGATGLEFLLFPELAALSHDVLTRPGGKWASQPVRLVVTPAVTAVLGTLATRLLPYHVLTILLIVGASLVVIALLRSAIAPAISAGVLPLVFGVRSWLYPVSIVAVLLALAGLLVAWRRWRPAPEEPAEGASREVDEVLETPTPVRRWLVPLLLFVALTGFVAQRTGLRFLLFPPLVVMAYEMFGHPETCPWARRPRSFPIACFLTALGGLAAAKLLGGGAAGAAAAMAWGLLVLRGFDIHMPPALAVGLIPLVMKAPGLAYPLSVGGGTAALTASFLVWRRSRRQPAETSAASPRQAA